MNSHRRWRRPFGTTTCGRRGSQYWRGTGGRSRRPTSCGRRSSTSQRSRKPMSSSAMPSASRTNELAPSAPTTQLARAVDSPAAGSRLRRSPSSTWSACCSSRSTVRPRWQLHGRLRPHRPVEGRLEERLVEDVRVRPAGRSRWRVKGHDRLTVRAEPLVAVDREDVALDRVDDPEPLPDPHGLVVEADRARQPVWLVVPLEHPDAHPRLPEERGKGLSDRPVADDREVEHVAHDSMFPEFDVMGRGPSRRSAPGRDGARTARERRAPRKDRTRRLGRAQGGSAPRP